MKRFGLFLIGLLMIGSAFAENESETRAQTMARMGLAARAEPKQQALHNRAVVPFCPIVGGSTAFEEITDVRFIYNAGANQLRIEVDVDLKNPAGCTVAPCATYDPFFEYVDVWIDFDSNGILTPNENVLNQQRNDYQAVAYDKFTFVSVINPPVAGVFNTRTVLRYNQDDNNPCLVSWSFGNFIDKAVSIVESCSNGCGGKTCCGNNCCPFQSQYCCSQGCCNNTLPKCCGEQNGQPICCGGDTNCCGTGCCPSTRPCCGNVCCPFNGGNCCGSGCCPSGFKCCGTFPNGQPICCSPNQNCGNNACTPA